MVSTCSHSRKSVSGTMTHLREHRDYLLVSCPEGRLACGNAVALFSGAHSLSFVCQVFIGSSENWGKLTVEDIVCGSFTSVIIHLNSSLRILYNVHFF